MTYRHPNRDPNLNNLHHAMEYRDGVPHLRVNIGSDTVTINGTINVDNITVDNTSDNPVPIYFPTTPTVNQGTGGNSAWKVDIGTSGEVKLVAGSALIGKVDINNWPATQPVSGTVTANVTFPTTQQVSGTVALDSTSLSALENINATVSGTVELGSTTLTALENVGVTGTVTIQDGGGSITVDGNVTATISGTPTVNIGTIPEVEIKNDTGNPIPISATTTANSALNPIYIAGNVSTIGGSAQGKLWFFQIAQGLIAGHRAVFKAGYNPSIANNTEESLWSHSVTYPWASWGAGGTLSCVSASASDTGTLYITGLKASDWTEVSEQVTMTGTTPVVTTNSFIRINSLSYSGSATNVGEIHTYRNGGVVGYIGVGEGQGQMAQFSVPAGYTAYILNGNANMGKGNDGFGKFKYRMYGGSFQTAMTFLLFQSTFDYKFEAPLALPEKSDLDVTMLASVSGSACSCAYSLILIQNGI